MPREMKDSGIEWIGEIPKNWEVEKGKYCFYNKKHIPGSNSYKYDRLALTLNGVIKRSKDDSDGLQPADFNTYQLLQEKELVFKLIDLQNISTSRVGLAHSTGLVSPAYIVLHGKEKISPEYAEKFYLMMWYRNIFNTLGDSGVRSSLNTTDLLNIPIIVPPLSEQQKIANFLDTKCSEIDQLHLDIEKQIEVLEKYKKSVITEAVTKGLDPDVEMKDSGIQWIGEIPKDWEVKKITYILDNTHPYAFGDGDHGTIKADEYVDDGIPYIRVQNINWCSELSLDNVVYITEQQNKRIQNSTLKPGDILYVKTGATIGKTGIIPNNIPISNTTSHVGKITVSHEYNSKYILYVLSSYVGYKQLWDIASQKTTRPELSIAEAKAIRLLIPRTMEVQNGIVKYLDDTCNEIDSFINQKKKQLIVLEEYKKSLIYEYVTGKKEVPDNE